MTFSSTKAFNIRTYVYLLLTLILSLVASSLLFYKTHTDRAHEIDDELIHYHLESSRLTSEIRLSLGKIEHLTRQFSANSSRTVLYKELSPSLYEISKEIREINRLQAQYPKATFASLIGRLNQQFSLLREGVSPDSTEPMTLHRAGEAIEEFEIVLTQFQLLHLDLQASQVTLLEMERRKSFKNVLLFVTLLLIVGGFLVSRILSQISAALRVENELKETLAQQAIKDPLTGLNNRRYFATRIVEEVSKSVRRKQMLAILLCDLDAFKTINDRQGHQMGDSVLQDVAESIQGSIRGSDLVFRWGGDEIVVVLIDTSREGVITASERIREGIQKVAKKNRLAGLDVSIGAALCPEHGTQAEQLVQLADRAMYIAKKGNDKVCISCQT